MKKFVFALMLALGVFGPNVTADLKVVPRVPHNLVVNFIPSGILHADSFPCTMTGFVRDGINLTAALINPTSVPAVLNAFGCNIGIYTDNNGAGVSAKGAEIFGANYFGIVANGDAGPVNVDFVNGKIHDIGENPRNGTQHGVAFYVRGFFAVSNATAKLTGTQVWGYQKGGIVVNGPGAQAVISGDTITGDGHVSYIAQNGVQIAYGASASVTKNAIAGNSYIGTDGSAAAGVLILGGAGYGTCPDGNDCPYTVNVKVQDNQFANNDVAVFLSNLSSTFTAPDDATNNRVVGNTMTTDLCYNPYTAGISDVGNNDKLVNNTISGMYTTCGIRVDADSSFTNKPHVHANK